jgi:hypothetical protein
MRCDLTLPGTFGLALVLITACDDNSVRENPSPTQKWEVQWVFVNLSSGPVSFVGTGGGYQAEAPGVAPGTASVKSFQGDAQAQSLPVVVTVSADPQPHSLSTQVDPSKITVINVTWNGTQTIITSRFIEIGLTAWRLNGISGANSANWQDLASTASGTLTFNVPGTVEEGKTAAVSATFSGSITVNPGWAGYSTNVTVGMIDRVTFGLPNATNSANTGALAVGTFSKSVTVNGAWAIPSHPTSLALEAGGNWTMAGPGNANPPKLIATYVKQ